MTTAVTDFQEFTVDALKEKVIAAMHAQMDGLAKLAPHPEYDGQLQTLTRADIRARKPDGADSLLGQFALEAMGVSMIGAGSKLFSAALDAYDDMAAGNRRKPGLAAARPVQPRTPSPQTARTAFAATGASRGRIIQRPLPAATVAANAPATTKAPANKAAAWAAYHRDMTRRVHIEGALREMSTMLDTLDALKSRGISKVVVTPEGRLVQTAEGRRRFHAPQDKVSGFGRAA